MVVAMQSGFSSCRREMFPSGLRVLVVDDDLPWLKILEKMLKKCAYEVTTCSLAQEALRLLRDRKDGFDIVISDVNMPDMDGFKLLEHVGLEMDLPVIMMSVDGETSRVMKGVQHGACDYLLKPIRMKELKNIWQHVVRKRMHDVRDIEGFEDRNDGYYVGDQTLIKKRKDLENKHDEKDSSDMSCSKKARVVWTVELHQKFVKAVNQIGIESDKIGPKKILDLMNVAWLTRENVASHLQKYRLYLSRIREEGETDSSFAGMKSTTDHSPIGSLSVQGSALGQQNDVSSNNHIIQGSRLPVKDSEPIDADLKSSKEPAFDSKGSISYVAFDPAVSNQCPWAAEPREIQFEQATGGVVQSHDIPGITHAHVPSISETDLPLAVNGKLSGNNVRQLSPIERALLSFSAPDPEPFGCAFDSGRVKVEAPIEGSIESFNVYPKTHTSNLQVVEPNFQVAFTQVSCQVDQSNSSSVIGWESTLGLPGEDLMSYWLQNDGGISKDVSFDYGTKLGVDYDPLFDFVEYPVDQGLTWV